MDQREPIDLHCAFAEYGERLLFVIQRRLGKAMASRVAPEDVLQEAYLAASRRLDFLVREQDVPLYLKLRKITLQTLTDLERRHLQSQKRSALLETSGDAADFALARTKADAPSPRTMLAQKERNAILRHAIGELSEQDRDILTLRHDDGMGNKECAAVLGIGQKAASIRYVRALRRLHDKLITYSEFNA